MKLGEAVYKSQQKPEAGKADGPKDANPKEIKPIGINLFLLICLNLLIDLIPSNIGIITA